MQRTTTFKVIDALTGEVVDDQAQGSWDAVKRAEAYAKQLGRDYEVVRHTLVVDAFRYIHAPAKPEPKCPEPMQQGDEYVCKACLVRWDTHEERPPCRR